jgi:RNA polymerase sigma factor (sigma-70 family)
VSDPDAELLDRARDGDVAAFGQLVERHRDAVFRATLAALRNRAEAEDAAQEAFLSAWRRLGTFRREASVRTWLASIAWHEALDRRRSLLRRLRRFVSPGPEPDAPRPEPRDRGRDPEAELLDSELASHVHRLAGGLPAKLRDPLLLHAAGDHTYDEMAAILGTPSGTLKGRVAEARRRLRVRLEALGYGDAPA